MRRGRARDALTLFDENGAIVMSSDASLLDDLRAFRWKRLFWERRDEVRTAMRFLIFGHALFQKALSPYVGMTAHALLLPVSAELIAAPMPLLTQAVDNAVCAAATSLAAPAAFTPLPLLGVPGWWPENEKRGFYEDLRYFRPARAKGERGEG